MSTKKRLLLIVVTLALATLLLLPLSLQAAGGSSYAVVGNVNVESVVINVALPILLTSIITLMAWIINKLNSLETWKATIDAAVAQWKLDYAAMTKPANDLKSELDSQHKETALHASQLQQLILKMELIFKKLEEMESRCLMHQLLKQATPADLVKILAAQTQPSKT